MPYYVLKYCAKDFIYVISNSYNYTTEVLPYHSHFISELKGSISCPEMPSYSVVDWGFEPNSACF